MSVNDDIAAAALMLETDVNLNHQIVHGDNTTTVATEGGPVDSLAKRINDIVTAWSQQADPAAADLAAAVQAAQTSEANASTSESATLTYRNEAEQFKNDAQASAATLMGGIQEFGTYDASTNTLPAKPATTAGFWKIVAAGTLDSVSYGVGDSLVYSKTTDSFYKIDNTESVTSVNGQQGVVTIPPASTTVAGIVQLTDSETSTSVTTAATPNSVKIVFDATVGLATSLGSTTIKADDALADAAAAQSTADTAVTNAAAAQSTADTAVTNAAAAQSTADTAVANAAAAQSTADTAVTNAAAAQLTADTAQGAAIDAINHAAAAQTTADGKVSASVANTFTAPQSGSVTADNDLSFDMSAGNNFSCTPTGSGTLTFTNITAGQSGNVYFDNAGGHAISAAASTLINGNDLGKLSGVGQFWVSYFSADGLNVSVAVTPALKAGGA